MSVTTQLSTSYNDNTAPVSDSMLSRLDDVDRFAAYGRVTRVVGLVLEATGLEVGLGALCRITSHSRDRSVLAEVVGFHERGVLLMPLGELDGLHPGSSVQPLGRTFGVDVGPGLLGRVLNGLGHPIDGKGKLDVVERVPLSAEPPNPLERETIDRPLETGVRAIDGLLTIGRGQRVGIFSGSGVGKSTMLGMIARHAQADVNVIALLGERGREVRDFIENSLGAEGLARSIVIVATGDQAALIRARGALVATAIAEYFRDQGKQVLLMVDSVTRVAMAWREIGLATGEPPTTKGYPPSVFAALPRLLERAGNAAVVALPAFIPCWLTATISTSPWQTRPVRFLMVTSCSHADSRRRITFRRSMSSSQRVVCAMRSSTPCRSAPAVRCFALKPRIVKKKT